jgi:glycosyltransferase involved in cell wall biosynthesis
MTQQNRPDIVLVSTADWNNPYWTNKQHMAVQFAQLGHKVFYIESQGLRAPTATTKDLKRIWARLKRGLVPPREVRPNLFVWSPLVIPLQGKASIRRINRFILAAGVRFWCAVHRIRPGILWTYSPLTTQLYSLERFGLVVYHAVDDIKAQPGMPRETIALAESDLSTRADLIFTTAHNLQEAHRRLNPNTHYFSNVADFEHFHKALDAETPVPADIASIPGPRIGFIGAISSYKLDFPMIRRIADAHPQWSFVFVGEIGEGDPLTDSSVFERAGNMHFLGGRPYASLPGYLKGMDVALQPNLLNDYTRSMFPMKFFEYLAAGKQVVSTELPALADCRDVARFCADEEAFTAGIAEALVSDQPTLETRLAAAKEQTYEIRTRKMMRLVDEALERRRGRSVAGVPATQGNAPK